MEYNNLYGLTDRINRSDDVIKLASKFFVLVLQQKKMGIRINIKQLPYIYFSVYNNGSQSEQQHYSDDFGAFNIGEGESEYLEVSSAFGGGLNSFGITTVSFDSHEELLWMGNSGGYVTSYYGGNMQKYTSFRVHQTDIVREISTIESGILALTNTSLRHQIRRGIPRFTHMSSNMVDMLCMHQISSNRIVMGGNQDKIIDFDLTTATETKMVNIHKKKTSYIFNHS